MNDTFARLRSMPAEELSWRLRGRVRTLSQRLASRVRAPRWDRRALRHALTDHAMGGAVGRAVDAQSWQDAHHALVARLVSRPSRFALDPASAASLVAEVTARWPSAAADAAARADRMLDGRYDILGYKELRVATARGAVDWHADPQHQRRAPVVFFADVPYLSADFGDHKIIWEINRHQGWLAFGRALWLTGDARYGEAIVDRLESWLAANPPLAGINWASMLELGIRTISWTWALHFLMADVARARTAATPWLVDMLVGIDRQLTHVEQNLSHYFSPNTHLIGEALSLYVVGLALPELRASHRWVERGRQILLEQIDRQIHADGGHAEGSMHYHRYTLDMYLHAWLAAERAVDTLASQRFADAVSRLADFARTAADDRGRLPLIGDDDGGMLWPFIGRDCRDIRDSLGLAALVLDRADLSPWGVPEEVFWIGGRLAIDRAKAIEAASDCSTHPASRTFRETGYVVARDMGDHAVFDVGPHGYMNAGHAHADALAVTLTLAGRPLLVDSGTSTYVMDPALRDRLRGTISHNTMMIDERPQSIPGAPFRWRTRSDARLHECRHNPAFDWAEASHDGYAPLRHRRTLLRTASGWLIADEILGSGPHTASGLWHFDPEWAVTLEGPGRLRATHRDGTSAWLTTDADRVALVRGDDRSGLGGYAPVYGTLIPAYAAQTTRQAAAPFAVVTWIGAQVETPTLERLPAAVGAITARVTSGDRIAVFALRPASPAHSQPLGEADGIGYHTDARVFHYATDASGLRAVDLVDATYARAGGDGWLSVAADSRIEDLHLAIDRITLDVRASSIPPQIRIRGGALATVRQIRLNGLDRPLRPAEASVDEIVILREQWTNAGASLALARIAIGHVSNSEETLCRPGRSDRHSHYSPSLSSSS